MGVSQGGLGQADRLLRGWKEIARFFGKDERTVKRWEATRGLPVQRPVGEHGTVFADADRLRGWVDAQSQREAPVANSRAGPLDAVSLRSPDGFVPSAPVKQFWLESTYLWQKRTAASLTEAARLLLQAISLEPGYAPAHAALAATYKLMGEYGPLKPRDAYPRALAAVETAISLDPRIEQGHTVLANIEFFWLRQFEPALRRFEYARRLNPHLVLTRHWYAEALLFAGRTGEALAEIDKAQELDPQSRSILTARAFILFKAGDMAMAEKLSLQLIANEPDYSMPYRCLAYIYLERHDHARYLAMMDRLAAALGSRPMQAVVAAGRDALHVGGADAMAERMVAAASTYFAARKIPAYPMAHVHALNGDAREALRCLDSALRHYEGDLFDYVIDPAFKRLRAEPGFQRKIGDLGLPVAG